MFGNYKKKIFFFMGCFSSKSALTSEEFDGKEHTVEGFIVCYPAKAEESLALHDAENATRFRGVDMFFFRNWESFSGQYIRFTHSEIKHCVHDISISVSQKKIPTGGEYVYMTCVKFTFPKSFVDSLPIDLKSLVNHIFPTSITVCEEKDCTDLIDLAVISYPEMETIRNKVLKMFQMK